MKRRVLVFAALSALLCVVVAFSLVTHGPKPNDVAPKVAEPVVLGPAASPEATSQPEGGTASAERAKESVVGSESRPVDRVTDLASLQDSVDIEALRANPAGEYVPETSEMGEDIPYEPQVALVGLAEGAHADDVLQALADRSGTDAASLEAHEFSPGYLHISLPEGLDVAQAIKALDSLEAVSIAQPNYYLTVVSDTAMTSEGGKKSESASMDELQSAKPEGPTGEGGELLAGQEGADSQASERAGAVSSDAASGEMGVDAEQTGAGKKADDLASTEASEPSGSASSPGDKSASPNAGEDDELASSEKPASSEGAVGPQLDAQGAPAETTENGVGALSAGVNDEYRSEQWGLDSISADDAWSLAKANRSVTVAVLDLGFDLGHPDLKQNLVSGYNSYNALHGGSTADVSPIRGSESGHGTHVAGIIGAVTNNEIGVAGATYNARVMPIKVVDGTGKATVETIAKAYDYLISKASQYNVRVVNLSMGVGGSVSNADLVYKKIDEAYNKGIVTVAAAGNNAYNGPYSIFPSDYDKVVSVISLKQNGFSVSRAVSSNYNMSGERSKNISAPGESIYSTTPSSEYGSMNGTSMATPFVSSVLALEFAAKPSLSAKDAVSTLYATARDIGASGWDRTYGWGEANAYYALLGITKGVDKAKLAQVEDERKAAEKAKQAKVDSNVANGLSYATHVQNVGWQSYVKNGATSGTSGSSLRLEAIKIKLANTPYSGSIQYRTHVQNQGWQAWKSNNQLSGTSGLSLRLEAIQIRLTGEMANHYDVWYHVHSQDLGWMGWTKNGEAAGTAGYGRRLEAIQIVIRPKGSAAPGSTAGAFTFPISYQTHVQNVGWQGLVSNGAMSGTSGQSLRLEGIKINVASLPFSGTIQYRTHVQNIGWEGGWRSSGQMSGTSGRSLRLEAIQIKLTGELSNRYDVWYRTHVQNYGWTGWTKNGASSGSAGKGYRLEGIQIRLVGKNGSAPGSTANPFYQ